jgi:nucleotide-binding universal stress UspA family protein
VSGTRRVIVGVSGSPGSIRALRYAADVAADGDLPLIAVLAWVPPGGDLAERRTPSMYLREIWRRAASQRLRDALESAWGGVPAGLTLQRVVARGDAGRVLVDVADADDILVVGAGEHGSLKGPWHGKVARYCLAHASCPVLAVPASPLARHSSGLRRLSLRRGRFDAGQLLRESTVPSPNDQRGESCR